MRQYILTQLNEGNSNLLENAKQAYDLYNKALCSAELTEDIELQGQALIGLSHASRNMGEISIGFKYANKALTLYSDLDQSEGIAKSHNFLGIFYFHSGLYQNALDHFYKAEKSLGTSELFPTVFISIQNNIAEVYQKSGNHGTSLFYYKNAYEQAKEKHLNLYEHSILSNMGKVFTLMNDLEKAQDCFQEALNHLEKAGDKIFLSEAHLNLSQVFFKLHLIDEANDHLKRAEAALKPLDNTYYFIDILLAKYQYVKASGEDGLSILLEALEISTQTESKKKMMDIFQKLSEYYEDAMDFKNSLQYYRLFHKMETEINANQLKYQMDILLSKHHPEQFNKNIKKLGGVIPHTMDSDSLKRKAHYDELTSLPNRYLIKMVLNYLQKIESKNYWLGILDLDHFKWVNDGMGHLYGDECLIKTAEIITQMLLPYQGFVGRFGGEEFLIILPDTSQEKGEEILSEIIQSFRSESIAYTYELQNYNLTASIGASYIDKSHSDWKSIIEQADHALYEAKSAGRDQLSIWIN